MKELKLTFIGKGQVKGFIFTQLKQNKHAYLYEINDFGILRYEVFKKKLNTQYNCISYPSNKAFGVWAWSCRTLETALVRFNEITDKEVQNGRK